MTAELRLNLPWVDDSRSEIEGLGVTRGLADTLTYDDGIVLEVVILDPSRSRSVEALTDAAGQAGAPGRVVLIAGSVPISWRHRLREAELSFFDVTGVAEIYWPRIRVSARRLGGPVRRRRRALSFQKGHALVAQELLMAALSGVRPTVGEVAVRAGVSLPTASKAVTQLAEHGLVAKERDGHRVDVEVVDRSGLAARLAERSAWPGEDAIRGFVWGRTVFDVAARLSQTAGTADVALAVTGRVGAAYLGVLGTSSPGEVRCWVGTAGRDLADVAHGLGLEPVPDNEANVILSVDRWGAGTRHRSEVSFEEWSASIAHPVRVWCDLHSEQRGSEFAAQLWAEMTHAR